MVILETCQKQAFDIIAITPRGTLGLCYVHIPQLMTHPAVYTLPFTLQLRYKPLGILQRVTKSQKVHISSHAVHSPHKHFQESNVSHEGFFDIHFNCTGYLSLVQQIFVDSVNFIFHSCNIKNKQICHYSLSKETVKLHQLLTSFQVNLEVCIKEF